MLQRRPGFETNYIEACGYDLDTSVVAIVQELDLVYLNGNCSSAEYLARS